MAYQLNNATFPDIYAHRSQYADLAAAGAVQDFGSGMSSFKITGFCKAGAGAVTATLTISDTVAMGTPVTVGVLTLATMSTGSVQVNANPAGKRFGRVTVAGGTMDVRLEAAA